MTPVTGLRSQFEARVRERGYTLDDVRGCIVAEDGETITVDVDHPAYPRAKTLLSLPEKAARFASSAARHVASGMPQTTDKERERRFSICQHCEFFDGKACSKCGCSVVREKRLISKLAWAHEECPVGKWGKDVGVTNTPIEFTDNTSVRLSPLTTTEGQYGEEGIRP
jgi:hypothetical protein